MRRRMMFEKEELPSGYTRLQYVDISNNTSSNLFYDTQLTVNMRNDVIEYDFMLLNTNKCRTFIIGGYMANFYSVYFNANSSGGNYTNHISIWGGTNQGTLRNGLDGVESASLPISINENHKLVATNKNANIDNNEFVWSNDASNENSSLKIACFGNSSYKSGLYKISKSSGTYLLIPCTRNSDSKQGYWCTENNSFLMIN